MLFIVVLLIGSLCVVNELTKCSPPPKCMDTRVRIIAWCMICKNANWIEGPKVGEELTQCLKEYFGVDWAPDTDCTVSDAKEVCSMFGVPP